MTPVDKTDPTSLFFEWTGDKHCDFYARHWAPEHQGYIYVIQGQPGTPVKIGTAKNVRSRIASLQTGNPDELRLLLCFPGDNKVEYRIHLELRLSVVRGEWFDGPDVVDWLKRASEYADRAALAFENSEPVPDPDFIRDPPNPTQNGLYPVGGDRKLQDRWRTKPDKPAPVLVRFTEPNPQMDPEEAALIRSGIPPSEARLGKAS